MTVFISLLLFCYCFLGSLKVYHLFAVCFYRGVGAEGHYYAETFSPTRNIWLRFNAASICRVTTWGINNDIPALIFYRLRTAPWSIQSTDTTPLPSTTPVPNTTPLSQSLTLPDTSSLPNTTPLSHSLTLPNATPPPNPSHLLIPPASYQSSLSSIPINEHSSASAQVSYSNPLTSPFHDRVFRATDIASTSREFRTVLFVCHHCGYTCSSSRTLTKHIQQTHTSYSCHLCKFRTDDSALLSLHIQKEHAAPLVCPICGHVSYTRKAAQQHCFRQHTSMGEFQCTVDECKALFNTKYNLIRHMKRVHKASQPLPSIDDPSSSSTTSSSTADSLSGSLCQSSNSDILLEPRESEPFSIPSSLTLRDSSFQGPHFLAQLRLKEKPS